jgi:hypothetical protein
MYGSRGRTVSILWPCLQKTSTGVSRETRVLKASSSPLRMLGYEWWLELCNLSHITVRLLCGEVPFLDLGPTYGPHRDSGLLMECTRTRGRIACMRCIREERPRLSLNDMRLVLKGFDLGAEWAQGNPHFCMPHTEAHHKNQIACAANLSKNWRGQW